MEKGKSRKYASVFRYAGLGPLALWVSRPTILQLSILNSGKSTASACMTALKRVALSTSATSSAQKRWEMVEMAVEEDNIVVRNVGHVSLTLLRQWEDFEHALDLIATLMTDHAEHEVLHARFNTEIEPSLAFLHSPTYTSKYVIALNRP